MSTNVDKRKRLNELEQTVKNGLRAFVDIGAALAEIRKDKLHLILGFMTFEEYVRGTWAFYARELGRLSREQRSETWGEILGKNQSITAKLIGEMVKHRLKTDELHGLLNSIGNALDECDHDGKVRLGERIHQVFSDRGMGHLLREPGEMSEGLPHTPPFLGIEDLLLLRGGPHGADMEEDFARTQKNPRSSG